MRILLGVAVLAMLAAPVSANLLSPSDAGFEDPWPDGAPEWYSQKQNGLIERDSGIHGPGGPHSGLHYGSLQTGGGAQTQAAWITIPASGAMALDMWASAGTLPDNGTTASFFIQLIDGDQNGAVLSQWQSPVFSAFGMGWTQLSSGTMNGAPLTGTAGSGQVTVKFGYTIYGGWSNGTAIHVDDVALTPEPAGLALMSLLGIPLLRRRRA